MSPGRNPAVGHSFAATRPTVDQFLALLAEINRTSVDFLKTDVETALTFSAIALQSSGNTKRRHRNRSSARRGYDTIVRFIERVPLTDDDAQFLLRKLERLKLELQSLGETF
jgi:hypothetical protein